MREKISLRSRNEKTSSSGVTIDGVLIKDGAVAGAADIGLVIALG